MGHRNLLRKFTSFLLFNKYMNINEDSFIG